MEIKTNSPQPVAAGAGSKARVSRKENAQQLKHTTAQRLMRVSRREIGSVWIGAIRGVLAGQAPVRVPAGVDDIPGRGNIRIAIGPGAYEWARRERQAGRRVLSCVPGISPRAYQWPVRDRRVTVLVCAGGAMPSEPCDEFARWLLVRWGAISVRIAGDHARRLVRRKPEEASGC